jgi:hypothetical protein
MRHAASRVAEVVVADIGSTLTKLSAFAGLEHRAGSRTRQGPRFLGQGADHGR